ncbi:MAG TPA: Gfo/Idh/MocA family oxidoreductase [Bryobacteraceae bacterium]|nr:Gfo/Idh/MocA family oxidoreductase [Bryobacteraceae bacterium]
MSSAVAAGTTLSRPLAGANDRVRVAVVGLRGQGSAHLGQYMRMQDVDIAALCDIDESILNERLGRVEKAGRPKPAAFTDLRKLLDDKSIDAVSIATPNHNHAIQTIWTLQAGKHVYCEKPQSHNIFESQQIVKAARKYNKIAQGGVNARSSPSIIDCVKQMREGLIGDVYMARGLCFKWRDTIGRTKPEPVPPGVHYDLWLGPAPKREFTRNRFHYNWHWFWEYGNGDFGNQGIHELDIARWGLGVKYPSKISAIGGHFMFDDDQETPNTLNVACEFNEQGKRRLLEFEVRHWISNHEAGIGGDKPGGNTVGNTFFGSKGEIAIDGYAKWQSWLGTFEGEPGKRRAKVEPGPSGNVPGNNWRNFIEAVKANDRALQNNEIEEGAISATLMHLGNISYRVGRTLHFDSEKMQVIGDKEANEMFTRRYRAPFVVPEKV